MLHLSNASTDQRHRKFSYLGQPEDIYYMRVMDMKLGWKPNFGTKIIIETTAMAAPGSVIQLMVVDKNGTPFSTACQMHQDKTRQTQAFVFRDLYRQEVIHPQNVGTFHKHYYSL